jgi:hypothetical protein
MKNLLSLLILTTAVMGLFSSCHKDFDTDNELKEIKNVYSVTNNGRVIKADALFHTEVITSNPMKAGEVYPNPTSAAGKGKMEFDLAGRFQSEFAKDYPGLTKEKLQNFTIHWIKVVVNEDRCKLLREYRINRVTLPDGTNLLAAPIVTNACENWRVNNLINDNAKNLYGKDISASIKANGKLVFDYSLTADKELAGKATGFTIEVNTSMVYQAN